MAENVLTNDEVGALLDGVESGEVEVHSTDGSRYASVAPYDIPQRSRIVSNSFPKLELLNEVFAENLRRRAQQLLHCELGLACSETTNAPLGVICDDLSDMHVAVQFVAPPLPETGAIVLSAELVHQLVEIFFGGTGSEPKEPGLGGFTLGELRVTYAFSNLVLETLKEVWEPVRSIEPEQTKTESSVGSLNIAGETGPVIKSVFEFSFEEHEGSLHLLLPNAMVEPLLPLFKGTDRKVDTVQDEMWQETISTSLAGIDVNLSTNVGHATMTLGELICIEPGDIVSIDSPRIATIFAQKVPLLKGRFGVHLGRNAVEAMQWFNADSVKSTRDGTHG